VLEWWQIAYGALLSGLAAAAAVRFVLRDRRGAVIATAAAAGLLGPLAWNVILHHAGGDFFVDAPGYVFPISLQDTGSWVFATAVAALLLGFGPLATATGRRLAVQTATVGLAALAVDMYMY
jgi:hypothetical protein